MAKKKQSTSAPDKALQHALRKAYTERARLFVEGIRDRDVQPLVTFISKYEQRSLDWNLADLGISREAFEKVEAAGVQPQMVFCHPDVIAARAGTLAYYRNLAALSAKGLGQIVHGLRGDARTRESIEAINQILSAIVEAMDRFDLALAQAVIPAEIGAELQGTWVNIIGQGAARRVKQLISGFVESRSLAKKTEKVKTTGARKKTETHIILENGWTIVFGSEPDISIRDTKDVLRGAIEIKGSLDRAGAQTRYGEAKKSFSKALTEHAQCETIYLASCFTDAVIRQINQDAQVRRWFNLVDILADQAKRNEFLDEIFKHLIRIV